MLVELNMYDATGGAQNIWAQIDLDYGTKRWNVQEHRNWGRSTFAYTGSFVVNPADGLWLSDNNTPRFNNKIVLWYPPNSEGDISHIRGEGEVASAIHPKFEGASILWNQPEMKPIRVEAMRLVKSLLPGIGAFLAPGQYPFVEKVPGVPGETNCYILPGWLGLMLGGDASAYVTEILPRPIMAGGGYVSKKVLVNINRGNMSLEKLAIALDARAPAGSKKMWITYDKARDNRPLPGDLYVLKKYSAKAGCEITAHVGIIVDAVGKRWRTADSGQSPKLPIPVDAKGQPLFAKGFSAGFHDRDFNPASGEIIGEDRKMARLLGWIDIDNPLLFPKWASGW